VLRYDQVLSGEVVPGRQVAVIGAGGIGVDISVWLTHDPGETPDEWMAHWGVADPSLHRGGLTEPKPRAPQREVTLIQRKTTPIGVGLGKTSGWAHRAVLKQSDVRLVSGASYDRIEPTASGDRLRLHLTAGPADDRTSEVVEVDHVVLCAGQESVRDLVAPGRAVIGGADVAAELDAERAIRQGTEVAAGL
jgi:2,4-dienoyl-CoA reductase (NADPH2)